MNDTTPMNSPAIEAVKTIAENVKESEKILKDKGCVFQGMLIVSYSPPVQCWIKKYNYCRDIITQYREINAQGYID